MTSSPFHTLVSLAGLHFEDSMVTVKLHSGIVVGDVGKALSWDVAAANTMKLAGDGDYIAGRLESVEDRSIEGTLVGTAALRFSNKFAVKASDPLAVGDTAVGGGNGTVKQRTVGTGPAVATPDYNANVVVEVVSGIATVVRI